LAGDPTISTANGEINLGLIAVNGITSGSPGGPLTFSGIRGLLLATQNGSIDLGPEISFSGLHDLTVYARGVGSDLTLSSAISGLTQTTLIAQGDLNIDGTTLGSQTLNITAGSGINLGVNAPVTVVSNSIDLLIDSSAVSPISNGGKITWTTNQNLMLTGDLSLSIANNDGGHIGIGGDISFSANSISTAGFTLLLTNYGDVFGSPGTSVGSIGTGGNIALITTGAVTADYVDAFLDNRNGASIGSSASITLNIGGALTTKIDPTTGVAGSVLGTSFGLLLSNRFDTTAGGTIAGNATISLSAASVSAGGFFELFLSNRTGSIGGSGLLNCNVSGALAFQESGQLQISNEDAFNVGHGGTIHGDAGINLSAGSISTPQELDLVILNSGAVDPNTGAVIGTAGGMIGGNALINVNTGSLSGDLFAQIDNRAGSIVSDAAVNVTATSISSAGTTGIALSIADQDGGSIGGDASLSLNATNLSVNGTFDTRIDNTAGTIHGNASMIYNTAGSLTSTGEQFYQLINADGGTIGGSATLDVTTKNLSSGRSLFVAILNSTNDGGATGTVASNATLNFNVSGTATVATDATFQINGSDSAASSTINFNGGIYNVVHGTFEGFMDGSGTMTFNNATIHADTLKAVIFGANGTLRIGGGSIFQANMLLHLYAPGSNGLIDFVGNTTLDSSGTAVVLAANTVTIENGVKVTIGGSTPANVYANVPNYSGRSGGNNSTSGTFAGAGATTQPLGGQPPFDSATTAHAVTKQSRSIASAGGRGPTIHVTESSQLGSLLNNATLGPDGKVRISPQGRSRNPSVQASTRMMAAKSELHRSVDAKARSGALASRSQ
jgi:filamentous hemagglutinin